MIEFFSFPVISGFTCAAATQIASTQLNSLFGNGQKADTFLDAVEQVFKYIGDTKYPDLLLGLGTMVFLFATKVKEPLSHCSKLIVCVYRKCGVLGA